MSRSLQQIIKLESQQLQSLHIVTDNLQIILPQSQVVLRSERVKECLVPQISIVDDLDRPITDKFYNAGSTLELRCVITHLPILYTILWKQGNKTLNYDTSRGGISVKTTIRKEGAVSVLYIANARKNDSGPYICSLGNLTQNTILVHVIN
ncbi:unnamed protein product, partial [Allacma fusca]